MKWLKDVYIYQGVKCEWDDEYMEEFNRMQPIIKQRRQEMMDKFNCDRHSAATKGYFYALRYMPITFMKFRSQFK